MYQISKFCKISKISQYLRPLRPFGILRKLTIFKMASNGLKCWPILIILQNLLIWYIGGPFLFYEYFGYNDFYFWPLNLRGQNFDRSAIYYYWPQRKKNFEVDFSHKKATFNEWGIDFCPKLHFFGHPYYAII